MKNAEVIIDIKMGRKISYWLKEGKQSKITPKIRKIAESFHGDEFDKIYQILEWIEKNAPHTSDTSKVEKIFTSRNAEKIIIDKFNIGCHDTAVLTATFLRALKIPAKFIEGIDKLSPQDSGHCVVEAYIKGKWILIDPSYFTLSLKPKRNPFYEKNYVIGVGVDSWDNGIKTFNDWKKKSEKIIKQVEKIH